MITRRTFLKSGAAAVAGAMLPMSNLQRALALAPAPALEPFVDPLPIPPLKAATGPGMYDMTVETLSHKYHRDLGAITMWGYDGIYPGPTFVATRGTPIAVNVTNSITAGHHPFRAAFDESIPGNIDDGRVAIHLHGGETEPMSDGNPMDHFGPGESRMYNYGNAQKGTTLWYHDHALGNTRLNVMAGLAGFYLLIDPDEDAAIVAANPGTALPTLPYMIGLAIQDRDFFADGSVDYPTVPDPGSGHFHWVPEYFANTACVNGKAMPYLEVEPRRYRFRVLNGSQARFYNLSLSNHGSITVLGSDGGYLAAPVVLDALLIAPGERYDVVIDFTGLGSGTEIVMTNDAVAPYPSGTLFTDARTDSTMKVMQFRVTLPLDTGVPNLPLPATLAEIAPAVVPAGTMTRSLFLNEVATSADVVLRVMLNNTPMLLPATEIARVGATEVWEIANTTMDTHPIHLHLVQFRLLSRRAYKSSDYRALALSVDYLPPVAPYITAGSTAMGRSPRPQEAAWKDTVLMHPGEVTRILVKFAPQEAAATPGVNGFGFDPTADPGYVWHCHILEHEENDMMRPLLVSNSYAGRPTSISARRTRSSLHTWQSVRLYGSLTPGELGDSIAIQVKRPGSTTWAALKTVYAGTSRGSTAGWSYTYKPRKRGTYYVRALFGGTADRSASHSGATHFHVK
jgi:FtsP/CotA-like multicopper oxidase with cupredoxin domain